MINFGHAMNMEIWYLDVLLQEIRYVFTASCTLSKGPIRLLVVTLMCLYPEAFIHSCPAFFFEVVASASTFFARYQWSYGPP
jgi:hypothetical protein